MYLDEKEKNDGRTRTQKICGTGKQAQRLKTVEIGFKREVRTYNYASVAHAQSDVQVLVIQASEVLSWE